jgi:cytoskeletal protein RodZ
MSDRLQFHPWQLAAVGLALVVVTVLLTRLVVVNWAQSEADPKVAPPSAGISPSAPACEPSPLGTTQVTRSVDTLERPSSTPPPATLRARKPRAVLPLDQAERTSAVAQEPTESSGEPAKSAMAERGTPADDGERAGRDSVNDGEAPRASKAPRRFPFKSLSRHDDPRGRAALSESP